MTNCLVFIHEEVIFYILNLAKEKQEYLEYDFTKIEALKDLEGTINRFDKYKKILSLGITDFINYLNDSPKFDTHGFYQGSVISINQRHKRDNLPYFWSFD